MDYQSKLESIHKYWFYSKENKKLWFQSNIKKRLSIDQYINTNYKDFLELVYFKPITNLLSNFERSVSTIICLDQFSRHI